LADEIREVVRLREGLGPAGLSEPAARRAISTLRLFKRFCDSSDVDLVLATTTSAVREAANGKSFLEVVKKETGLSLEILAGDREAYYGVLGAINEIPTRESYVVDIGGGSAQVSLVRKGGFEKGTALPIGTIALTERHVTTDPIEPGEFRAIENEVCRHFKQLGWVKPRKGVGLIGLGGTIRNLAKIEAARQNYPLYTLHGFRLSLTSIQESIHQFRTLPLNEREQIPGLKSDRADIILPGAVVIASLMEQIGADQLTLSMSGIREGIFYERFWSHLDEPIIPDIRRFSVLNLARNYSYDKNHANHVRYLCIRLFEQLQPLHGYGVPERNLLEAGALLHDIGTIVGYDGHDRHSQTLIEYNGLSGYSPREIALIGLLSRYHRKGKPDMRGYEGILRSGDEERVLKLAAILRLAEFLERGRTGGIDDVILTWDASTLRITLIADEYPFVELWQTTRNAVPLLEKAFDRTVRLDSIASPPPETKTRESI
jgi:exopolyphosphatase/guanosine-5'-triphosphate,3'-diphosphate pyrophosphatase